MNFSNIKSISWLKNYANWLPLLQWCSWIIAIFILAKIFWVWMMYFSSPTEFKPLKVASVTTSQLSKSTDINKLVALNLFGSVAVNKPRETVQEEAPVTQLNLKLRGIYSSDERAKANAIIEDGRGVQSVYFVDEKLAVSGNVFLRQVMAEQVILETNGKREALRLDVDKLNGMTIRESSSGSLRESDSNEDDEDSTVNDKRNDQRISQQLSEYKDKLLNDPKSVSDVIGGRPHFVDGELKGFSISPGKDRQLFKELGLQNGDLVTSINGISLTNMNDAMALMNDAQAIQDLNIEIERDGESINLLLNLTDKVGM